MGDKPAYRNLGELVRARLITFVVRVMHNLGYKNFGEPNGFAVETVQIKLKRLPRVFFGFRIAQISDIHIGGCITPGRLQRVAELVAAVKADVLVVTGGFLKGRSFSGSEKQGIRDMIEILSHLTSSICYIRV